MRISYKNLKRYREISQVLMKYGFTFIVEKLNIENVAYKSPIINISEDIKNMSTGEKIRRTIEELGPTYIKLGQILSTRKDLLDPDIIDELVKLRDNVESFDTQIAKKIFEEETGLSIKDVFVKFNDTPIAAASIGQVYEGILRKEEEEVILKIQRPDIENIIKADIEILRKICESLNDFKKDIGIDLVKVLEEFHTQLIRELDYNFEAMNAMKFEKIFKNSSQVHIPKIYNEYTTKKTLIMEKIEGIKINDTQTLEKLGWDTNVISQIGIKAFFKQVFDHGFFHADLHPGNIFVVSRDCISYIDFGMIGIIDNKSLDFLNNIGIAIVEKNIEKVIYLLEEMNILTQEVDTISLKQDLLYMIHYYYDVQIDKINIGDILNEIFRFLRKYKMSLPYQLSILAKTLITLEGTARQISPEFSLQSIVGEFAKNYYARKLDAKKILHESKNNVEEILLDLKYIPKQLKYILKNLENNNVRVTIEDVKLQRLERSVVDLATKLSLSLVLAALVVGSSLIISSPNINDNIWIKITAIGGFFTSFIIGILLVIKIFRTHYRR